MSPLISAVLVAALSLSGSVHAQGTTTTAAPSATITSAPRGPAIVPGTSPLPLTAATYAFENQPYKVNPFAVGRGPQSGYNICNGTTEGAGALCQTTIINSAADFCLLGSPGLSPNATMGDIEAAVVSYCTRTGHGGRIMPAGTITAVQFMRTSEYIQVTGLFKNAGINLAPEDFGGELDPVGADQLGNPLGGLVYSNGLSAINSTILRQVHSWNIFVGNNKFCFKACFDSVNAPGLCLNVYDLIGCDYNMPAAYAPNVFESCEGELQDVVGRYTENGQVLTWSQPRSLAPGTTLPWVPRVPASSNCVRHQSSDLYPNSLLGYQSTVARVTSTAASGLPTGTGTSRAGTGSGSGTASRTSGAAGATGTAASAANSVKVGLGGFAGMAMIAFVAML